MVTNGSGRWLVQAALLAGFAVTGNAALTVTAAGTGLGFSLTRFVTDAGSPGSTSGYSPLGLTLLPNGNWLVLVAGQQKNYVWPNVDGQNLTTAVASSPFTGCCPAYATSQGAAWGSLNSNLVKFDNNGAVVATYPSTNPQVSISNGLWTNPTNGHLLGVGNGIWDITLTGGVPTNFRQVTTTGSDGLSVSPDGTIVYTSAVLGFNIQTGAQVLNVPVSSGDGTGVISSNNNLNGDIIVNAYSGGNVYLIDVHNANQVITIANNGTRGDYTAPDTSNGTLLLTQSNEIYRLSCGVGCGIGSQAGTPSAVPTLSEVGLALMTLLLIGSAAFLIGRTGRQEV